MISAAHISGVLDQEPMTKNQIKLFYERHDEVDVVQLVRDLHSWQGYRMEKIPFHWQTHALKRGEKIFLDFKQPIIGKLHLRWSHQESASYDAPLRMRMFFAEQPSEFAPVSDTASNGLSASWIQEEIYTLDSLDEEFESSRRFSFRYVSIEIIAFSQCGALLEEIYAISQTSADEHNLLPPPPHLDETLSRIDQVGIRTLRNCMQSIFEDGPKRDRRLWIGDLKLQLLTNAVTYRNFDLIESCLKLLAAVRNENGLIPGCVFDRKRQKRGCDMLDYSLLFGPTLLDHLLLSKREACVRELFDLSCLQIDLIRPIFEKMISGQLSVDDLPQWVFIDHVKELDKEASFVAIYIYSLKAHAMLAEKLRRYADAEKFANEGATCSLAARAKYYRPGENLIVSGKKQQISHASLVWFSLAGILSNQETRFALERVKKFPGAIKPASPYLWHYYLEMLFKLGLNDEAWGLIRDYWGGMVKHGADTFWEIYVSDDENYTTYGDKRLNSACHAWSCTPSFFIRNNGKLNYLF